MDQQYSRSSEFGIPAQRLWDWHMQPGAFGRLAPPWQNMRLLTMPERMESGARLEFELRAGLLRQRWRALLTGFDPPRQFMDQQVHGPFAAWKHTHRIEAAGESACVLADSICYRLPLGLGAMPLVSRFAKAEIDRLFRFRHQRMTEDFKRWGGELPGAGRRILVTGLSGLIGRRLQPLLETLGFVVVGLARGQIRDRRVCGGDSFRWDPVMGEMEVGALEGVYGVVHLAGENIAAGRWSPARKRRILNSRMETTSTLVNAMAAAESRPAVLLSMSGVNIYPTGSLSDEHSAPGNSFLATVCRRWEAEAMAAAKLGVRTVLLRSGVVLDPGGGALAKMLPAYRLGLGGPVGSGRQHLPWISIDDLLDIMVESLLNPALQGPLNAVAPQPVTQLEFNRALGSVLRRPAFVPLPAAVVRLIFGEMGDATLLADLPVTPRRLLEAGFCFRHPDVQTALAFMLGNTAQTAECGPG